MGSSKAGSNPKFATLTGYKMAGLWQEVRLTAGIVYQVVQALVQYRRKYQAFRNRWGGRAPRSEQEWLTFWQEFVLLEDDLSFVQDRLMDSHYSLMQATDEGTEVVRLNGIETAGDAINSIRRSLERAVELIESNDVK